MKNSSLKISIDGMMVRRTSLWHEKGSAMIELALIMPMFTLLLAGAADFARLAYASIEVSNAARAGVVYGMQNRNTALSLSGMKTAAINDAADVAAMTATASEKCVCTSGTTVTCANAGTTCVSPGRILQYVTVNTTATLNTLFQYPGLPSTLTLNGQATMRVEQ
jgi:Flp pilus assembly protein TadG